MGKSLEKVQIFKYRGNTFQNKIIRIHKWNMQENEYSPCTGMGNRSEYGEQVKIVLGLEWYCLIEYSLWGCSLRPYIQKYGDGVSQIKQGRYRTWILDLNRTTPPLYHMRRVLKQQLKRETKKSQITKKALEDPYRNNLLVFV